VAPGTGLVDDLLSPGALADDILIEEGLVVYEEDGYEGVLTADDILTFEVPDTRTLPVLGKEGLIMEGAANLLYSFPKTGKTELLTALVTDWVTADQSVLYLTEEPFPNWKQRLAVHGCSGTLLRMFYAWGGSIREALDVIESESFDILVVDTLRNTVGYMEGKGDEDVARVIHPLLRAAKGRTSICSFHARKMPGDAGRDISGHHSLYGAFDRALRLAPIEGQDTHRKITVSGRCMYEGDQTLFYRQVQPGLLEVLDAASMSEAKKERVSYELVCLECGDDFTSTRRDTKCCSSPCRLRRWRHSQGGGDVDAE
jgi:hypothetical protein